MGGGAPEWAHETMTDSNNHKTDANDHKSPAEASREGLEQLDGARHKKHQTTEETAAVHPSGAKFDETEIYRGEPQADKQK